MISTKISAKTPKTAPALKIAGAAARLVAFSDDLGLGELDLVLDEQRQALGDLGERGRDRVEVACCQRARRLRIIASRTPPTKAAPMTTSGRSAAVRRLSITVVECDAGVRTGAGPRVGAAPRNGGRRRVAVDRPLRLWRPGLVLPRVRAAGCAVPIREARSLGRIFVEDSLPDHRRTRTATMLARALTPVTSPDQSSRLISGLSVHRRGFNQTRAVAGAGSCRGEFHQQPQAAAAAVSGALEPAADHLDDRVLRAARARRSSTAVLLKIQSVSTCSTSP